MPNLPLTKMEAGTNGPVVKVDGGHGLRARLDALGIRPGVKITKVSGQIMHGPIIVRVGATQIAIGFGMAARVVVEVE
jgi:ferrous iron transport protein A